MKAPNAYSRVVLNKASGMQGCVAEPDVPAYCLRYGSMKREEDRSEKLRFRAERTFRINGEWFASTREGKTLGPFVEKVVALENVAAYIALQPGPK